MGGVDRADWDRDDRVRAGGGGGDQQLAGLRSRGRRQGAGRPPAGQEGRALSGAGRSQVLLSGLAETQDSAGV